VTRELDDLRARIAAVDDRIVALVAERLALVRHVGAAKRSGGLPVRSYATESEVVDRLRRLAGTYGLDERVADAVAAVLIGESVRAQEEAHARPSTPAQRILLIGGAGKMGRWLARFFGVQGHAVSTFDPAGAVPGLPSEDDLAKGVAAADVVLVATPLAAGAGVLADLLAMQPAALVADIFSLKSHVVDLLRDAATRGVRVASLHPLFGPGVRTLSGRVLAVCDCGNPTAADAAAALWQDTALTITRLPLEHHDRYMVYVLGLSHLSAILFFTTLARSPHSYAELARLASTTFLKEARTAAEVARESPHLYHEIQHLNDHSATLFGEVRGALAELEAAALDADPQRFVACMERGRRFFPESLPLELR
jgi:chorismate mutase/prephenate dehydrogenase